MNVKLFALKGDRTTYGDRKICEEREKLKKAFKKKEVFFACASEACGIKRLRYLPV